MFIYSQLRWACLGVVLAGTGCGTTPTSQQAAATAVAPRPTGQAPKVPVAPLIQALLDTAAAGSARAADARRGLQAGADVRAFYGPAGTPAWTTAPADSLTANATAALALLARAAEHGLRPADYGATRLRGLRDSLGRPAPPDQRAGQLARLDVYLSDAVLRFMRDLSRGRLRRYAASAPEKAAGPAGQPAVLLRAAVDAGGRQVPAAVRAGQPANREYRQLQQALAQWLARPAAPDSAAQHQAEYEQAALNLERWRWDPVPPAAEYALINIPAFELQVVVRDSVRRRHRVVVGTPATPTPTLSSAIRSFTLAPDWHVPHSIATRELLPHLKRDADYLARNNYALYDERGQPQNPQGINWARVTSGTFAYTVRQSAGCENALGNIVFRFANPYSVYLHDTPLRQLFARPGRALSHGCIRLDNPFALAAYLLRREGRPALLPSEEECARQPRPREVRLARPLPLYIRYATCTAVNGRLRCWPDVYHRDEAIRRELFGGGPKAAERERADRPKAPRQADYRPGVGEGPPEPVPGNSAASGPRSTLPAMPAAYAHHLRRCPQTLRRGLPARDRRANAGPLHRPCPQPPASGS
ncbi:L,D-transpeptidase family protein [Hymenobacter sp.]|uniref:L,D-transpeptidase family protein n=1 Tax=Hymenobacter sp. TaxID=1898978 RepID=UPI00286D056A|nr:L,D-transpeptidase family protein [Hymenobacter sp.]